MSPPESETDDPYAYEPFSMIDWPVVERTQLADGTEFVLGKYKDDWVIRVGIKILMSNQMHDSEETLAEIGLAWSRSFGSVDGPKRVLVGGLGLGYTARAVLDKTTSATEVTVLELVPELVDWNREHLGALAGFPLKDPRCKVIVADVFDTLKTAPNAYDLILLDVDNGPQELTQPQNQRIYSDWGVKVCLAALRPGGVIAVWSQGPNARFQRRLQKYADDVEMIIVDARAGMQLKHVIFVGRSRAVETTEATQPSPIAT